MNNRRQIIYSESELKMKRDELRKKIVGPMATVATPLDKEYKVDYGRMHDMTNWWVDNGLKTGNSVIKIMERKVLIGSALVNNL